MRRALALMVCAALTAGLLAQPKPPSWPMLNANDAKLASTATLPAACTAVSFLDAKGLLVAGDLEGSLHVWQREEGKDWLGTKPRTVKAHGKAVTGLAAAGGLLVSSSVDGKALVWPAALDKPANTITLATPIRSLAASADGKLVALGGEDGAAYLYDPSSGKEVRKLPGHGDWVTALTYSPDGKLLAAGTQEGKLFLWEADTGKKRFDVLAQAPPAPKAELPPPNVAASLAFSPDGKQLLLGGSNGSIYAFDPASGKLARTLAPAHSSTVTGLWWHPASYVLVSVSKDRVVQLWSPTAGSKLKALAGHDAWVEGVTAMSQGTEAVTVGADRTVRLWSLGAKAAPPPDKKK
jgi:WD40 repeat protein